MKVFNLIIACLVAVTVTYSAEEWRLLGLEDHSVNCITYDFAHRVIAGTDKGLFIKDVSGTWLEITQHDSLRGLPVTDVAVTSTTRIVATRGRGSDSGGLYAGDAIWGPPYYQLYMVDTLNAPQSLEFISGDISNTPHIYVGNSNSVKRSSYNFTTGKFGTLTNIKIPPFAFGVEQPICADIHFYRGDNKLYVGGYDGMSMNPGNGNLLWKQGDSMSILIPKLNVTALTEDATLDCVLVQMYIGTVDSGIYYSASYMSHPPIKLTSSPNDEKVNDLITIPLPIAIRKSLCAAVPGGIYYLHRQNNTWNEIGDIPAEPKCLYVQIDSTSVINYTLYAGTDNGVYVFDTSSVSIEQVSQSYRRNPVIFNKISNGMLTIGLDLDKPEKVSIAVYNAAGKRVFDIVEYCNDRKRILNIDMNNGMQGKIGTSIYILKVKIGSEMYFRKFVYTR
jgi:ligand-binding sensor domain-containing protein